MGKKKAKSSRKGKKEWRANIGTEETENYFIKQGQEERSGGPLDQVPDESLFFVDKSKGVPLQKKTEKNRGKVLHFESILQRNSLIPPLKAPLKRKSKLKDRDVAKPLKKNNSLPIVQKNSVESTDAVWDLWADRDVAVNDAKRSVPKRSNSLHKDEVKTLALEVDAPGCSYNPRFDDHQEALGEAVAEEMSKIYKRELEPEPIPKFVPGHAVDEEDVFFLEADDGNDDEEGVLDEGDAPGFQSRVVRVKKLTRAELNKKARKRENLRHESKKRKLVELKKDVLRLPDIMDDIAAEEQDKEARRIRRKVCREERRARGPPRLGKYRFKAEPAQVLLTEEVTGSLRKLKPCFNLLRDRFKSLQRNGLLEPRVPVRRREPKNRVMYEAGSKGQKEREMHAAMEFDRAARKEGLPVIPVH